MRTVSKLVRMPRIRARFWPVSLETEDVRFHTRIVTAPGYAKAFFDTLRDSIAQHEEQFGAIRSHYRT